MKNHESKNFDLFSSNHEPITDDNDSWWERFIGERNKMLRDLSRTIKNSEYERNAIPQQPTATTPGELFD